MRHAQSLTPRRSLARVVPLLLLCLALVTAAPVAAKPPVPNADPAVITFWNDVTVTTVSAPASPTNFLYFAFTHLAMYNAVVGITGEYEMYRWDKHAPTNASPAAAAAAAAHRVLTTYFPAQKANLDAKLTQSLAGIADGGPQDKGVAWGVRAADRIIALRVGDGRGAAVTVPLAPVPNGVGHWEPTSATGFTSAWIGGVTPIAIASADAFDPGRPPQIGSREYLAEFNEVRDYGGTHVGNLRTEPMRKTALFYSDAGIVPMQAGLRDFATRHRLDIDDSARMFAAAETAIADGSIAVWNAKLQYMWWRPVTAIRDAAIDTDPNTVGLPGGATWSPLITTPPYPEWPSGLCSVVGAASTVLERLNGNGKLDLKLTSAAADETRTFETKSQIATEAVNARVWSGIHFRTADVVSIRIGSSVADYVLDHYFQPTD